MGQTREQRIIKQVTGGQVQRQTPIMTDMFLPNHSGMSSHPEVKNNFYTKTEVDALIAVENLWDRAGTTLSPHTAGDDITTTGTGTFGDIVDNGLTASQALMTDANKKLISVDYLDQAVKTTSSPTFASGTTIGSTSETNTIFNILTKASGGIPELRLMRNPGVTDWRMRNNGGYLYFDSSTDDGSNWDNLAYIDTNGLISNRLTSTGSILGSGFNWNPAGTLSISGAFYPTSSNTVILGTRTTAASSLLNVAAFITSSSAATINNGIGTAFSMRATASDRTVDNVGYYAARFKDVTAGSSIGELILNPTYGGAFSLSDYSLLVRAVSSTRTDVILPIDNSKFILGAGEDASIYYDGSDMILSPDDVGSGDVLIGATANKTIDAGAYKVGGTAGADATFSILDGDGITSHDFVFTKGILTSYGTS